jgi:hypothetical protein
VKVLSGKKIGVINGKIKTKKNIMPMAIKDKFED